MIYRATTPLHVTQVAKSTVGIRPITGGQGIAGVLVIGVAEHRSHLTIVGRRRIISPLTMALTTVLVDMHIKISNVICIRELRK